RWYGKSHAASIHNTGCPESGREHLTKGRKEKMALVEIGMTQETIEKVLEPMEPGEKTLVYMGLLTDAANGDSPVFITSKGGKMVKAKFQCISSDPVENGKGLIYNGVIGSFSFAELVKRIPLMVGTSIDSEAGIGMEFRMTVSKETYLTKDGETKMKNEIKKFLSA
ncbi:MAG: hypothetical protein KJ954_14455, partial [Alphaproteobacteria bacterium]|nr:hypothetical protein [Alphaproteobacteria bacterium]